jgi:hypothetical protein
MYIHPPHGATQISNPNFTSEGVANSSQNPSRSPASASEEVANSSQNPSNPASASEGVANPSQKPCTHNPKSPQHIIPFLNWLTIPSVGTSEASSRHTNTLRVHQGSQQN